ncbi:MAG TPA: uracil-DNA glycosylase [Usitatibacter sp.]|jgi:hypothetical protein|nr:uracil-DNA glycosylase [Usitatibacter sp.]
MPHIDAFLALLQAGPPDPSHVFNPWRDHDDRDAAPRRASPGVRRDNMRRYLEAREKSARFLLLGEAPSHRGCRFTGIAFCSEVELVHKRDQVARVPLELTSAVSREKPMRERSAAVIWDELERAGCARDVVLWNAFPWHPHGDTVTSNRRPRKTEVQHGREPLRALLACFTHELRILAVGKVAEEGLGQWPEFQRGGYLRHPAQGGEALFRAHFREQVASRL